MLKLIRNRAGLVLAGLVAALCPMLMAPSGGFPSNPTFQTLMARSGSTFGPFLMFQDGAGTQQAIVGIAGGATSMCGTGAAQNDLCIRSSNHAIRISTDSGVTSSPIATVTSGSYTGTITGCTTAPTVNVLYTVIGAPTGGLVNLRFGTNACTSNATSFSITGAPAAIRPTSLDMTLGAVDGCGWTDNSAIQCGKVSVGMQTTGTIGFFLNGTSTGWTAAGGKSVGPSTYSYPLQ